MKTGKILLGVGFVAVLLWWSRKALAASANPGGKDVSSDSRLNASPIQPSKVAAAPDKGVSIHGLGTRSGITLLPPSTAFQNPSNSFARYKYDKSTIAAHEAPLRPDYTLTNRTQVVTP